MHNYISLVSFDSWMITPTPLFSSSNTAWQQSKMDDYAHLDDSWMISPFHYLYSSNTAWQQSKIFIHFRNQVDGKLT